MKRQLGFSILELVMVIAISTMMMSILLRIYHQVTQSMARIERFVYEDSQILTLKNRLQKDFSGLSAIWYTQEDIEKKKAAVEAQKPDLAKEKIRSSQYFYSVNKHGNLDFLTFITTNALQSYGSVHNRFVRVVYRLEVDPVHKKMFRLMRKEVILLTEHIDESSLKSGTSYELVTGITSLEMTYHLVDKVELQNQMKASADVPADSGAQQASKPIIRSVKQWTFDGKKKKENDKAGKDQPKNSGDASAEKTDDDAKNSDPVGDELDLGGAVAPKFVEMKIVFGATRQQQEKEYKLVFCIPSWIEIVPQSVNPATAQGSTDSTDSAVTSFK